MGNVILLGNRIWDAEGYDKLLELQEQQYDDERAEAVAFASKVTEGDFANLGGWGDGQLRELLAKAERAYRILSWVPKEKQRMEACGELYGSIERILRDRQHERQAHFNKQHGRIRSIIELSAKLAEFEKLSLIEYDSSVIEKQVPSVRSDGELAALEEWRLHDAASEHSFDITRCAEYLDDAEKAIAALEAISGWKAANTVLNDMRSYRDNLVARIDGMRARQQQARDELAKRKAAEREREQMIADMPDEVVELKKRIVELESRVAQGA